MMQWNLQSWGLPPFAGRLATGRPIDGAMSESVWWLRHTEAMAVTFQEIEECRDNAISAFCSAEQEFCCGPAESEAAYSDLARVETIFHFALECLNNAV